jgi:hypothetical protein
MNRIARLLASFAALATLSGSALADPLQGTLYKDPNCDCCESHASYLRENGINVDVQPVSDLAKLSKDAGVPPSLLGCHVIMLDGYVFEGHITSEIIKKCLAEKPKDVIGLTMPGMPTGVPGMGGKKISDYLVYAVKKDGSTAIYAAE